MQTSMPFSGRTRLTSPHPSGLVGPIPCMPGWVAEGQPHAEAKPRGHARARAGPLLTGDPDLCTQGSNTEHRGQARVCGRAYPVRAGSQANLPAWVKSYVHAHGPALGGGNNSECETQHINHYFCLAISFLSCPESLNRSSFKACLMIPLFLLKSRYNICH